MDMMAVRKKLLFGQIRHQIMLFFVLCSYVTTAAALQAEVCEASMVPYCESETLVYCDEGREVRLSCDLYADERGDLYVSGRTCGQVQCGEDNSCEQLAIPQCVAQAERSCDYYGRRFFGESSSEILCKAGLSCVGTFQYRSDEYGELNLYFGEACRPSIGECEIGDAIKGCEGTVARSCQQDERTFEELLGDAVGLDCATLGRTCGEDTTGQSFCEMDVGMLCDDHLLRCATGLTCGQDGLCELEENYDVDRDVGASPVEEDNTAEDILEAQPGDENESSNNSSDTEIGPDDSVEEHTDMEDNLGQEGINILPTDGSDEPSAEQKDNENDAEEAVAEYVDEQTVDNPYSERPTQVKPIARNQRRIPVADTTSGCMQVSGSLWLLSLIIFVFARRRFLFR